VPVTFETVIPNPKLKLPDQLREVMRLKHYSIRTERTIADWVRRYVHLPRQVVTLTTLPASVNYGPLVGVEGEACGAEVRRSES
jgi:hypothetical protein